MKDNKQEWWLLGAFVVYSTILSLFFYHRGHRACEATHQHNIDLNQQILETHEKIMDSVRHEPDADAYRRFKQNFGTE
ncbi:hypothetical protein [Emticicia sp. 17c]|uniref:hypothetical protein n=1 Tax=Emticicia sp. 17c TaxID=3127704 RepID=UPI00301DD2BC